MVKTRLRAVLIASAVLLLGGCGGDDDDGNPVDVDEGKPPAAMVGSWTFQSVAVNGAAADLSTELEWHVGAVGAKLHIQSNAAFVYEEVNTGGGQVWFESGFVFVDGAEMDINTQLDGTGPVNETTRVGYVLGTGMMSLTEVAPGDTVTYSLTM